MTVLSSPSFSRYRDPPPAQCVWLGEPTTLLQMKTDKSKLSLARVCLCMGLERTDCPFRVPSASQVQFVVKAYILWSQPGLRSGPSLPLAVSPRGVLLSLSEPYVL